MRKKSCHGCPIRWDCKRFWVDNCEKCEFMSCLVYEKPCCDCLSNTVSECKFKKKVKR